ncbi:MAG: ParA family protein [Burkholderiales bacterium]|nr:ParA family protein [Burkholderiales bacterium]
MSAFKILVTSQKGGVGKSTVSANLAAYLRRQGQSVTLVDFDTHGSSSTWLNRAPNIGIVVQHHILPLDQGGNRPILDARLHLRRAASSSDIVICDLTWTDSIAGELMFEYDLVVVPTSVSEIELVATSGFLNRHRWVFDSAIHTPPTLLLCPTRVRNEQMQGDTFTKQRFPVSFMLAPPVLEAQSARESFERGYLMDLPDECGASFIEFGKAVCTAREMRASAQGMRQTTASTRINTLNGVRSSHQSNALNMPAKNLLGRTSTLSNQYSVLGRHRLHKVEENAPAPTQAPANTTKTVTPANAPSVQEAESVTSMGIPQFLKRMSMGMLSK